MFAALLTVFAFILPGEMTIEVKGRTISVTKGEPWEVIDTRGNHIYFNISGSLAQSAKSSITLESKFSTLYSTGALEMKGLSAIYLNSFSAFSINSSPPAKLRLADGASIKLNGFSSSFAISSSNAVTLRKASSISVGDSGNVKLHGTTIVEAKADIAVGDTAQLHWFSNPSHPVTLIGPGAVISVQPAASFYNYGDYAPEGSTHFFLDQGSLLNISSTGTLKQSSQSSFRTSPYGMVLLDGSLQIAKQASLATGTTSKLNVGVNAKLMLNGAFLAGDSSVVTLMPGSSLTQLSQNCLVELNSQSSIVVEPNMSCVIETHIYIPANTHYVFGSNSNLPNGVMCLKK